MPNEQHPLKVFLCHASQDKPAVRELAKRLAAEGWIDPWLDEKKLLPGQDWRLKIEEAVETSDIVIICLSRNSVSKEGYVQNELRYAREIALEKPDETIFLIPLRLDDCETPRGLRFFQWADYFGESRDETYAALLQSLELRYQQKSVYEQALQALQEQERLKREKAEKALREKAERERAEQIARQKLELEMAEKARREEADRKAMKKAEQAKAKLEAAERIKRERAEKRAALINVLKESVSEFFYALKLAIPKARPVLRIVGVIVSILVLLLAGWWAIPRITASLPPPDPEPTQLASVPLTSTVSELVPVTPRASTSTPARVPSPSLTVFPVDTALPEPYQIGYVSDDDVYVAGRTGDPVKTIENLGVSSFYWLRNRALMTISANGQYVAVTMDGSLYYYNVLTGESAPLMDSVYQRIYSRLAWSPNNEQLFARSGSYDSDTYYIITTSGSNQLIPVKDRPEHHDIFNVSWSPDSKQVAFWESGDVFVFDPETKLITNVTRNGAVTQVPFAWSPDGTEILFTLRNSNAVHMVTLDTGDKTALIEDTTGLPDHLRWSHDGTKLAYTVAGEIYIYDFLADQNTFLVSGEMPVWSPDNIELLFLRARDLLTIKVDGTGEKLVATSSTEISHIFWIDLSELFEIDFDEIIPEGYGSSYTYCTWIYYWRGSGNWHEHQCSCTKTSCSCSVSFYDSRQKQNFLGDGWKETMTRAEVDRAVSSYNGSCQDLTIGP